MNGNGHRYGNWASEWETLAVPAVLIATGMILLGAAAFGLLSFDRIQNLWPFAVILIGLCELMPSSAGHVRKAELEPNRTRATRDA